MKIRKATEADVAAAAKIYDDARRFMRASGNTDQWANGYPNADTVREDIRAGVSYVCEEEGEILGVFMFSACEDPTYEKIYAGAWKNNDPYTVIHRIAVSDTSRGKGVAAFIFRQCFERFPNLKIDTHRDNIPMQHALERAGFAYCGIIYLATGDERLAYQKS